jgi:hypothetical protein
VRARFAQFAIDSETRQLLSHGREIHLSPKAFDLLCTLVETARSSGALRWTGELAVRKALGARTRDLVATIGRPALTVTAAGIVTGLTAALALTRLLGPQLWNIGATDPLTFASAALALAAATLAGCLVPLRSGLSVDPAVRLGSE